VRSINREDDTNDENGVEVVAVVAVVLVVEAAVGVAMHGQVVVLEIQGEVEITEMDWICSVPLV
jgi:hypothetical protein